MHASITVQNEMALQSILLFFVITPKLSQNIVNFTCA